MKRLLQFFSGRLVFLFLYFLPYQGPSPQGRVALAVFAWMVTWWMTQPVPWAILSLLPLLLFPAFSLMSIGKVSALYGQTIFFWIWGTVLMGYAMERHGLANRFALWFLSRRLVAGNTLRLAFGFMLVTALISTMVSDAATVAMMIPVGVSLVSFVRSVTGATGKQRSRFGSFLALGTLYAAVAGGTATIAGIPHNALSVALLEKFTGRTLGWFEWMKAGSLIFVATLVTFYLILRWFFPPEISSVPGGEEFLRREREKLGPLRPGERATLFVFAAMIVLFTLPTAIDWIFGRGHPLTQWSTTALSLYVVPQAIVLLLFCTPVNWRKGEFVLTWPEAVKQTPWNIMILCTAAAAVVDALVEFGFVKFAGDLITGLGLGPISLPFVAAAVVAISTNFISGTAATTFFGAILIPAAQQIGFNPASMAMLISNAALGIAMPWAGAAAATAFGSGELDMKEMMQTGIVATLIFAFLVAAIHIPLSPFL